MMVTLANIEGYITEDGELRVQLPEGLPAGQVRVRIEAVAADEDAAIMRALGEIARLPDTSDDSDAYLEEMADEIAQALSGGRPLSEIIIEERDED